MSPEGKQKGAHDYHDTNRLSIVPRQSLIL